nr:unnamed protein product [Digitaria exilis]
MALSEDTKVLLQAQVELWNQTFSFMKSVALAVALDLRIADAIHHHGGAATLSQILSEIGVSPCKLRGLRRLMRVLAVAGTFTMEPPEATSIGHEPLYKLTTASFLVTGRNNDGESSARSLSPMLNHVLNPFRDSELSMCLAAWFRHEGSETTCVHGAANASINNAMAADSRFLMQIVLKECGHIFHGIDSLVDVAGGVGGASAAIAVAFPSLKCTVLDLAHVVAKAPSLSNVQFVAGDMFERIPPTNAIFLKVRS